MSTVMYCYWVDRGSEFELANKVRKFLWQEYFIFNVPHDNLNNLIQLLIKYEGKYDINMQLFPVLPDRYLVRFLTSSFVIENNHELLGLEPCFYDDRTDVPPEDEENEKYANRVDELIKDKKYYIIPIVEELDIIDYYFKQKTDL